MSADAVTRSVFCSIFGLNFKVERSHAGPEVTISSGSKSRVHFALTNRSYCSSVSKLPTVSSAMYRFHSAQRRGWEDMLEAYAVVILQATSCGDCCMQGRAKMYGGSANEVEFTMRRSLRDENDACG